MLFWITIPLQAQSPSKTATENNILSIILSKIGIQGATGADGSDADATGVVTTHSDVSSAGSGAIITDTERTTLGNALQTSDLLSTIIDGNISGVQSNAIHDALALKADIGSEADNLGNHTATTDLDLANNRIKNLAEPISLTDAATRSYVDASVKNYSTNVEKQSGAQWINGELIYQKSFDFGTVSISETISLGVTVVRVTDIQLSYKRGVIYYVQSSFNSGGGSGYTRISVDGNSPSNVTITETDSGDLTNVVATIWYTK